MERIITVEAVAEELLFQSFEFWITTRTSASISATRSTGGACGRGHIIIVMARTRTLELVSIADLMKHSQYRAVSHFFVDNNCTLRLSKLEEVGCLLFFSGHAEVCSWAEEKGLENRGRRKGESSEDSWGNSLILSERLWRFQLQREDREVFNLRRCSGKESDREIGRRRVRLETPNHAKRYTRGLREEIGKCFVFGHRAGLQVARGCLQGDFVRLSGNTETNNEIDTSLRGLPTMNEGLVTEVRVSLMERKDSKEFNVDARSE
ncbi:hypothetical protein VNO77_43995 [Canavalia gladiata]|uniref:Uncharacterized protein n=1 Tax=Canavalia gladiata TaxID=3824 RepID=A0AAN9JXR6_CANGL